jgi:hypothetical protein
MFEVQMAWGALGWGALQQQFDGGTFKGGRGHIQGVQMTPRNCMQLFVQR